MLVELNNSHVLRFNQLFPEPLKEAKEVVSSTPSIVEQRSYSENHFIMRHEYKHVQMSSFESESQSQLPKFRQGTELVQSEGIAELQWNQYSGCFYTARKKRDAAISPLNHRERKWENKKEDHEHDLDPRTMNQRRNFKEKSLYREIESSYPGPVEPASTVGLGSMGPSLDNAESVIASAPNFSGGNVEMSNPITESFTLEPMNDSLLHLLGE